MSISRAAAFLTVLLAAVWLVAAPALAQTGPTFPPLSGRVVDNGDLISDAKEQALAEKLAALERDTTDQLVVVTVPDLQGYEIEDYGYQLGRAWRIGQADKNNGVLLIVAPRERKVRIEVGYGLEGVLTDAVSALIIQNEILPSFKEGFYERGIEQGVDAIDQQLRLDPAEAQARAAAAERPKSKPPIGIAVIITLIFVMLLLRMMGGAGRGRPRRGSGVGPVLIWAASEALRNSGRGGGGGFGGGGGGGGFGGGGGSFGGGGASGGW
ncbi:YgcG family protein [Brevundimonas sp. Root1423]|uniref:TPM domain-containing protein n=1 Tax=unclassified Brevundimonas TaxID=2622653 RepID=UPI0006FBEAEF|nr:TPM domain-containing protein [Brevundimonas sp. Root1423]KQY86666.1 methanol dehydrogenase [Brevundimonas sp. Root1423]KRA19396.1 methanol dehydrogenase [Brevundimonas sp. Root608]